MGSEMADEEVNIAVARKLGYDVIAGDDSAIFIRTVMPKPLDIKHLPDYCTSIKAAWEIVEFILRNIQNDGDHFDIGLTGHGNEWLCVINELSDKRIEARADTAPMAICLAFLKLE